jgi:hypothetical protein
MIFLKMLLLRKTPFKYTNLKSIVSKYIKNKKLKRQIKHQQKRKVTIKKYCVDTKIFRNSYNLWDRICLIYILILLLLQKNLQPFRLSLNSKTSCLLSCNGLLLISSSMYFRGFPFDVLPLLSI